MAIILHDLNTGLLIVHILNFLYLLFVKGKINAHMRKGSQGRINMEKMEHFEKFSLCKPGLMLHYCGANFSESAIIKPLISKSRSSQVIKLMD